VGKNEFVFGSLVEREFVLGLRSFLLSFSLSSSDSLDESDDDPEQVALSSPDGPSILILMEP
jgi:hypothetical protein